MNDYYCFVSINSFEFIYSFKGYIIYWKIKNPINTERAAIFIDKIIIKKVFELLYYYSNVFKLL